MYRRYTLSSGKEIECWYNDLGYLTALDDNWSDIETVKFDSSSRDPEVTICGEKIKINDFNYYKVDELIERLKRSLRTKTHEDRRFIFILRLLETLLRDTENVGIVGEVECFHTICPALRFGLKGSGSRKVKILLVPFEGSRFKKKDWHYKIEFHPEDERLRPFTGTECFYLEDLSSLIKRGYFELVNVKKYREQCPKDDVDLEKIECLVV